MQSQRLAKSVSQALVGSAQAFTEVRTAPTCWRAPCAASRPATTSCACRRWQPNSRTTSTRSCPWWSAPRSNAAVVLGQQKILTQVGAALRTINRQSSDLLEMAETVSSLKLQQNAAPAEISAAGQLVMLTQRIGKSANEFLTHRRREPRGRVPAGQGPELLQGDRRRACWTAAPSCACPAPRTRRRASAWRRCSRPTKRRARRPAPFWATCRAWCPRVKRRRPSSRTASRCAARWRSCRSKLSPQTGLGARRLDRAGHRRRCSPSAARCGLAYVQLQDSRKRQEVAESQRQEAERQEQEAKRVNDANQAAILAPDERTADGGRRRPDAGSHRDRGHHRRHRRLGELHGGRTAPAGGQRAEHGHQGGADHGAGGKHLHRAAGGVHRTAARDPRNRPVGAGHGRSNQPGVRRRRRNRPRWRASRCRPPSRASRPCRTPSAA